jgi:SAM-dependent methyltransferase
VIVPIALVALLIVVIATLIWWLSIHTEGVYLGRRVVVWLYDVYASRYDNIKSNDDEDEHDYIAAPLLKAIAPNTAPLVLDVAGGTGRIPMALWQHNLFEGHVVCVDRSLKMLEQGVAKLDESDDLVTFMYMDAMRLHFADASFDVVTCMEALEFFPDMARGINEWARVLRDGGLLLTTMRQNAPFTPNIWDANTFEGHLREAGFDNIRFQMWQQDYQLVWATKRGTSDPIHARPPEEVATCPACGTTSLEAHDTHWRCNNCHHTLPVANSIVKFL